MKRLVRPLNFKPAPRGKPPTKLKKSAARQRALWLWRGPRLEHPDRHPSGGGFWVVRCGRLFDDE